ncbi:AlpA family phage regulatory protein [Cupriavidus sp. H18C2]|uniref:AlpA family phage regulatory protein n=1 Tax=Cupriavidus sp. H18C2 TaxID=3241602 RepID=UPI003BF7E804
MSIPDQQDEATGGVPYVPVDPWQYKVEEMWLPFALTDSERLWLEGQLPKLPPLRYPMSDEEVAAFLDAYRRVEKRPAWEPVLLTAADLERRKADQAMALARHRKALQDEFAVGIVTAVDGRYVPVPVLAMGSFIPREQAIAYLERCGLAHDGNCARPEMWATQRRTVPGGERPSAAMPEVEQARGGDTGPFLTTQKMVKKPVGSKTGGRLGLEGDDAVDYRAKSSPAAERRPIGKIARLRRVMELTGLGRSSIYNRMDSRSAHYDPTFPCSFPLGATGGAVGWDEEAIKTWVAAQVARARQ